jgi:uncharacterized GH25 family protein
MRKLLFPVFVALIIAKAASAHDIWLETNTNIFRVGDVAHVDLKLGNHGNDHRDFKMAGKVDVTGVSIQAISPSGKKIDLKNLPIDTGLSPREGFWKTMLDLNENGIYTINQTSDEVVSYAPKRSIKSAKTFLMTSTSLDNVNPNQQGFEKRLGHEIELVPETNPVAPMGPGTPLKLRLWFKGKPLPNTKISFIPEGETLKEGFDTRYEVKTNVNGRAAFTPKMAGKYLVAAHVETKESGDNKAGKKFEKTAYSATLTVFVPAICPCCS